MSEPIPETANIEIYAKNIGITQAIATQLAQIVQAGTVILLSGNLGSGKTTFMQAFGRSLGITTSITSPTFTLIDEYTEGRLPLYHIDLYRLEPFQIPSLHLEEYWRGQDFPLGIVAIEWASKLINIPPHHFKIDLSLPNTPKIPQEMQDSFEDHPDAEYLSEERIIKFVAQGSNYVEMLRQFQF